MTTGEHSARLALLRAITSVTCFLPPQQTKMVYSQSALNYVGCSGGCGGSNVHLLISIRPRLGPSSLMNTVVGTS